MRGLCPASQGWPLTVAETPWKSIERMPVAHGPRTCDRRATAGARLCRAQPPRHPDLSFQVTPQEKPPLFLSPWGSQACLAVRSGHPSASTTTGPGQPTVPVPGGQAVTCSSGFGVKACCVCSLSPGSEAFLPEAWEATFLFTPQRGSLLCPPARYAKS